MTRIPLKHHHKFLLIFAPLQRTCQHEARACKCGQVRDFEKGTLIPERKWVDGCALPWCWCALHPDKHIATFDEYMRKKKEASYHG